MLAETSVVVFWFEIAREGGERGNRQRKGKQVGELVQAAGRVFQAAVNHGLMLPGLGGGLNRTGLGAGLDWRRCGGCWADGGDQMKDREKRAWISAPTERAG